MLSTPYVALLNKVLCVYVKMFKIKGTNLVIKDNSYLEHLILSISDIKQVRLKLPIQLTIVEPLNLEKIMFHKMGNLNSCSYC